ncbi:CRISPR-associated helicase/endonuclease Cas3 [Desulfitibacter alkalitolerans]|uniref:CRISPR-associated helicase/endonuclease Cas3 n=1 Tax=Desulfitibacter alkalitolerans TaxID=264641 RepID=UPI0005561A1E|nr:CRISPR-associated helicase/endonuclease Cas3 [Desulfitibacter alkalitolerans]
MGIDKKALAKSYPEEDIQTHTNCLLDNLELLKKLYPNLFVDWGSLYILLKLACIYHDLGKLYPKFQSCLRNRLPYIDGIPHGLLSLAFIHDKWLYKEKILTRSEIKLLFHSVAYHHDRKMPLSNDDIEKEFASLEKPFKRFQYDKLPIRFVAKSINQRYFVVGERLDKENENLFFRFIMLEGLLNRLDYAASANVKVEHPNDFLIAGMGNLMDRWKEKHPQSKWNDLQIYMQRNRDKNVVVIAQTGMGKTEAGLLWLGNSKGFFTLPLKSAINAIYKRIVEDVVLEAKEEKVGMLHSDTYTKYLEESESEQKKLEEKRETDSEGTSADLYYTRTKQLSLPLTICTLDQLFSFVFLYRGFEYKLATLAYSKVIIDEIQMYSPELTAYLVLGLRYMTRMGGRFAILTATLPAFFLDLLKEQDIPFEPPQVFTDQKIRHSLKVLDREINGEDIAALSRQYGGKRILVICNTIQSAVTLYHQLQWDEENEQVQVMNDSLDENGEKTGVYLLHNYFTKEDRAKKEKHIIQMGKKGSNESGIWIATQIVEASLDIDFDLLLTELSDLNGLFQRMGRCYRNRDLLDLMYNCFVFINRCSGVGAFIDKEIFRLSKTALLEVDGIIGEAQKVEMIQKLYTKENLPEYYLIMKETIDYINSHTPWEIDKKEVEKRFRNIDTVSIIPRKVYESRKEEIREAIEVLQKDYRITDREQARKLRARAREVITKQTVDISKYLYLQIETETIRINDYEQIQIAQCDYNSREGIIRPVMKKKADETDFFSNSF